MELIRGKKFLRQIFIDHWQSFLNTHPNLRPAIVLNVEKILACGTEKMGFHLYKCPTCLMEKRVPHTCKSRFCPSCGVSQTDRWIEKYTTLFANTYYQHIVFHPPSEFRPYFAIGRTAYFNSLYTAVNLTLKEWYKNKKYLPGIMTVMHTFGKDIKFTPHIHMLITCGGINSINNNNLKWIPCFYIPHQLLKTHFKQHFVNEIRRCWVKQQLDKIPEKLRYLFISSYQTKIITSLLSVIWYVHVGVKLSNASFTVRYIGRYAKRPAIAESRIKNYNGTSVAFTVRDNTVSSSNLINLSAYEFIGKLIRHIPDVNFRLIRYSGFYASRVKRKLLPKVFTVLNQSWSQAKERLASINSWWRKQIERFTKHDPLICPVCFIPLALVLIINPNIHNRNPPITIQEEYI